MTNREKYRTVIFDKRTEPCILIRWLRTGKEMRDCSVGDPLLHPICAECHKEGMKWLEQEAELTKESE